MKKIILSLAFVFAAITYSFAQTNELLSSAPSTEQEFKDSEPKFLNSLKWLEDTPLDKEAEKRKNQYALLTVWMINSPTVTIEVNADIANFTKKNADLLIYFMAGWTRYCIQNNYSKDALKCNLAGIRCAMEIYKKGVGIKKDKNMEKLIAMEEGGELETWVGEQLSKK